MNSIFLTPEIREVIEATHFRPAVSIIMPLEPKISVQTETAHALKIAADKVEMEIKKYYPDEAGTMVVKKLRSIISVLDLNTRKPAIAIYVSPVFDKVMFLDVPVEEKIIIDESFEIRDLIYSKKQLHKYLVLQLSGNTVRTFVGNAIKLDRIETGISESVKDYENDAPSRVANFSDIAERKEITTDKFLLQIDEALGSLLKTYDLPVFVLGTEKIMGHFKKLSRHAERIIEYVPGNYEEASIEQLQKIIQPFIENAKKAKDRKLLEQLEEAAGKKKLAVGMNNVWREAMNDAGHLLLVEKNYIYAARHGDSDDVIKKVIQPYNTHPYINDAVDDVIEKVIESGGDVEFMETDTLKDYQHIALIKYF